ncbi:MAG: FecR domain-containing protein [Comamonadaceae bacterium]|nr:FecR domain-containing protein [Comamonadaceae bacterium]
MNAPGPLVLPPPHLVEHALLLLARRHGGSPAQAEAALAEWHTRCAADPAFAAACRVAEQAWQATDASALRDTLALPPRTGGDTASARAGTGRRRALGALGAAALTAALGHAGHWWWRQPLHQQALATGHGEIRPLTLPDGTRLTLDAHTRVSVRLYRQRRELHLHEGEIHLHAAADPARPLTVHTRHGRVRVLGTIFSVAARHQHMHVAVAEGRVAIWHAAHAERATPDLELRAGQQIRLGGQPGQAAPAPQPIDAADVGAWQGGAQSGWLVFHATPLPEVVARWNHYLSPPLHLQDPAALQALRLTGSFPLRDPAAFLASLPRTLPVTVQPAPGGSWRIALRHQQRRAERP